MDLLFCGKATPVATCHRHVAKSRLSNPPSPKPIPKQKHHPKSDGVSLVFALLKRSGLICRRKPVFSRKNSIFSSAVVYHIPLSNTRVFDVMRKRLIPSVAMYLILFEWVFSLKAIEDVQAIDAGEKCIPIRHKKSLDFF